MVKIFGHIAVLAFMIISMPCMGTEIDDAGALARDHEALIVTALNSRAMDSRLSQMERGRAVEAILLSMRPHAPGSMFQGAPWAKISPVHQTGTCFGVCVGIGSGADPKQSGFEFTLFPDEKGRSVGQVDLVFDGRISTAQLMSYLSGDADSKIDLVGFILHDTLHSCFAYYFPDPHGEHFHPAGGPFGCLEDTIRRKPE